MQHPETFEEAVQAVIDAGVAFIVATYGQDALDRVDLNTLDLSSPFRCILGQLEGNDRHAEEAYQVSYSGYAKALNRHVPDSDLRSVWAAKYGLDSGYHDYDGLDENGDQRTEYLGYDALTDLWRKKIHALRGEGGREV